MLYNFSIFTKSGVVLYSKENQRIENNPLNYLVKEVLIKQRGDTKFLITNDNLYTIRWIFDNTNGLIFVAIYPKQFGAPYVDDLLNLIRKQFCDLYIKDKQKLDCFDDFSQFEETFNHTFKKVFELHSSSKSQKANNEQENSENRNINNIIDNNNNSANSNDNINKIDSNPNSPVQSPSEVRSSSQGRVTRKPQHSHGKKNQSPSSSSSSSGGKSSTPIIKKRVWGDKLTEEEQRELDRSRPGDNNNNNNSRSDSSTPIDKITLDDEILSDDEDFKNELKEATEKKKSKGGFFSKYLPSLSGRTLTEDDLVPVMEELRSHLTSKNVALEISEKLCESVKNSLEGQSLSSFTSVKTKVKEAMTNSIVRILTPNREIDVLREVQNVNAKGKPYSIVFVGVNGVGKSTSLSKVCAWLIQHGLKVMVAACDTFRSGAVEQLKVHTDRLKVPLYQQGYGKDPSSIAAAAINQAQKDGVNVVLIDTAGRMQDNEPLMKSLSSLVHANDPDLVLFVGEALVGNDGVHQLNSFNDLLQSLAASLHPGSLRKKEKVIDGVFLTKYDTIDDKVGAALSMVYSTGIPILFVGVGQHYTDIKKMNPESVVKLLMN